MAAFNPRQSYKKWMFTLNNPIVAQLPQDFIDHCEFITYQLEKGEQGTPHFQGYLVLKANPSNKNGRTMKWMKDNMSPHMHWDAVTYGNHEDRVAYCNKEEGRLAGPWTHGHWSDNEGQARGGQKSGEKNASKILTIKRKIDAGEDNTALWQEHFGEMMRYAKGFDRYRMTLQNTFRKHQTKGVWIWGPPGTGKSHRAREFALKIDAEPYYLKLNNNNQWFDGMRPGCKVVVIEDFRGNAPISFMLTLLDHTPMNVETKGSMMPFAAEWVVFTSNSHPRDVYGQQSESKIPLEVLNAWSSRFEGSRGCIKKMEKVFVQAGTQEKVEDIFDFKENCIVVRDIDLTADESLSPEHEYEEEAGEGDECSEDEGYNVYEDCDDEGNVIRYKRQAPTQDWDDEDQREFDRARGATAWMDGDRLPAQPQADFVTPPTKVYCDCTDVPCDGEELLKKLRRTDTQTLGIEKIKDKRLGAEPVQSILKFSARRTLNVNDDGDDN